MSSLEYLSLILYFRLREVVQGKSHRAITMRVHWSETCWYAVYARVSESGLAICTV